MQYSIYIYIYTPNWTYMLVESHSLLQILGHIKNNVVPYSLDHFLYHAPTNPVNLTYAIKIIYIYIYDFRKENTSILI